MNTLKDIPNGLLAFRTGTGFLVTVAKNIVLCEADGNYAWITTLGEKRMMVANNLKSVLDKLPKDWFVRVHNSFAVNLLHVKKVEANGSLTMHLSDGHKVEVSHRKRPEVMAFFENLSDAHT